MRFYRNSNMTLFFNRETETRDFFKLKESDSTMKGGGLNFSKNVRCRIVILY